MVLAETWPEVEAGASLEEEAESAEWVVETATGRIVRRRAASARRADGERREEGTARRPTAPSES